MLHHTRRRAAAFLAALMLLLPSASLAETVVTSFYPIYLFALNLCDGLDDVAVHNLAAPGTGCLHDYQLQTRDMKQLAQADVFLINGAGMESYLPGVTDAFWRRTRRALPWAKPKRCGTPMSGWTPPTLSRWFATWPTA